MGLDYMPILSLNIIIDFFSHSLHPLLLCVYQSYILV